MTTAYRRGKPVQVQLETIDSAGHLMEARAAAAFRRMAAAALRDGIELRVNSAFRDNGHQARLWTRCMRRLRDWRQTPRQARGPKPKPVAPPGHSLHQSGLAVDINRAHDDHTDDGIANGETDRWLAAHASEYGFARTVASEPWHWEYKGES